MIGKKDVDSMMKVDGTCGDECYTGRLMAHR